MTRQKTVETRSHLQVHSAGIREPGPVRHDWNDRKNRADPIWDLLCSQYWVGISRSPIP